MLEQKASYVGWFPALFEPSRAKVFLDETALKPGDMPTDQMIYTAVNCPVAIVIISSDFLINEWPLFELAIFAARLDNKDAMSGLLAKDLCIDLCHYDDSTVLDNKFELLADFYNPELKEVWYDSVLHFPLPIKTWSHYFLWEDVLASDHAKGIVKETEEILSKQGRKLSAPKDHVGEHQKLYNEFRFYRNKMFELLPKRSEGDQINPQFYLRVILQAFSNEMDPELANVINMARLTGRGCLTYDFIDTTVTKESQVYFNEIGYKESTEMYFVCALLDAVNWQRLQPMISDLLIDSWGAVVALNTHAKNTVYS